VDSLEPTCASTPLGHGLLAPQALKDLPCHRREALLWRYATTLDYDGVEELALRRPGCPAGGTGSAARPWSSSRRAGAAPDQRNPAAFDGAAASYYRRSTEVRPYDCITEDEVATVTLRIDDQTRDELEQLARGRDSTVSDVLRRAIDELLGRETDAPSARTPRSLNVVQRHSLALLHEILSHLDPDEDSKSSHKQKMQVLRAGFTTEYDNEFLGVDAELPAAECVLVMDLLDMFTVLEAALARLDEADLSALGDETHLLEFIGFDFNNTRELRLAVFARYLIEDGRWPDLAHHFDEAHERGNSHMPTLDRYQRMLTAYRAALKDRQSSRGGSSLDVYRFGVDELKKVRAAAHYPRQRDL
jgi:uncharacterized protein